MFSRAAIVMLLATGAATAHAHDSPRRGLRIRGLLAPEELMQLETEDQRFYGASLIHADGQDQDSVLAKEEEDAAKAEATACSSSCTMTCGNGAPKGASPCIFTDQDDINCYQVCS
mmetsp:Transcript_43623/g.126937  ORF Transcript_43623/g.126937 Transcript_43623/m.126937 type:complete len:116 (-) Transcript_43623:120-467(-)